MEEKVFNVSQVNKYVKMLIDSDAFLNNINITGEITNFKAHYTGHFYFTLKDENSSIKCVMFKSAAQLINFKPEDGMKVVISGQINVFERDGVYQIYCRTMKQAGLGELYIAYEKLKKKLQDEGLFDEIYKKKIPFFHHQSSHQQTSCNYQCTFIEIEPLPYNISYRKSGRNVTCQRQ